MSDALNQFDPLARRYRWLEYLVFQKSLEQCRFALLPALAGCRRVLTIGEGDGRFVAELVRRYPEIEVDCLEGSQAMIARARARLPEQAAVTFHHADAVCWDYPVAEYDAVVTCFFLDCFRETTLADWVPRVQRALRPAGCWAVAEFCEGRPGWRRWRSQFWLGIMYAFFRRLTSLEAKRLPNWKRLLTETGGRVQEEGTIHGGLLEWSTWC